MRARYALLPTALILGLSAALPAGELKFPAPSADSYVQAAQPDKIYGAEVGFQVRNSDNRKYSRIGYLRYDLGDKLKSKVSRAEITLTLANIFQNREKPSEITIYGWAGLEWDEQTLCDANAPWSSAEIKHPPKQVSRLGSFTVPATGGATGGQTYEVATPELADFLEKARQAGEKSVTFFVVEAESMPNLVSFVAKENGSFPATSLTIVLEDSK
jgi:hypothetical protein